MVNLNTQNNDGDTPLHLELQDIEMDLDVLEFALYNGANVHIRNFKGRNVLHEAVKYSHLGMPAVDLLLECGASLNGIDDQGATVLHDALKNPRVNLTIIKKLLEYGAYPDYRDEENLPPLAYCEVSSLRPAEKELAAKLLIQYTVISKLDNDMRKEIESGSVVVEGDEILCLNFCKNNTKRNAWSAFRDSCIAEIMSMAKLSVGNNNLLKFVTYLCYNQYNESMDILSVKEVLSRLASNEYPLFRDFIISTVEECGFDVLVNVLERIIVSGKNGVNSLFWNSDCICEIAEFLSKVDLINLILAFM